MFFANMIEVQYCVTTNVPPSIPMKNRAVQNIAKFCAVPTRYAGIEKTHSSPDWAHRGPHRSATGPMINRIRIVPATPMMFDVTRSSFSLIPMSGENFPMFTSKGDSANHPKNAKKKDDHAKKNARWCGRSNLHGFSTLHLCFSSTGHLYIGSPVSGSKNFAAPAAPCVFTGSSVVSNVSSITGVLSTSAIFSPQPTRAYRLAPALLFQPRAYPPLQPLCFLIVFSRFLTSSPSSPL
mmetsp:Transcript_42003/g.164566  ORF Transcript_42003/g.164566 Transcript_42003/m.164566 type:complete len:237 (+) Transcript_42003:1030-1740(+)